MDAFTRNLVLMLLGCAMLLGLGFIGLLAPRVPGDEGLSWLLEGPAPVWLALVGLVGLAAIVAVLLRGPSPDSEAGGDGEQPSKSPAHADEATARSIGDARGSGAEQEPGEPLEDPTAALIQVEVVLGREGGRTSPAVGADIPPAALCKALWDARSSWLASGAKSDLRSGIQACTKDWRETANSLRGSVPVRGRTDGEAAGYRVAAVVHVPPGSALEDASGVLELMGALSGDRFIEFEAARTPAEAETYARIITVTGSLAARGMSVFASEETGPLPADADVEEESRS